MFQNFTILNKALLFLIKLNKTPRSQLQKLLNKSVAEAQTLKQ